MSHQAIVPLGGVQPAFAGEEDAILPAADAGPAAIDRAIQNLSTTQDTLMMGRVLQEIVYAQQATLRRVASSYIFREGMDRYFGNKRRNLNMGEIQLNIWHKDAASDHTVPVRMDLREATSTTGVLETWCYPLDARLPPVQFMTVFQSGRKGVARDTRLFKLFIAWNQDIPGMATQLDKFAQVTDRVRSEEEVGKIMGVLKQEILRKGHMGRDDAKKAVLRCGFPIVGRRPAWADAYVASLQAGAPINAIGKPASVRVGLA